MRQIAYHYAKNKKTAIFLGRTGIGKSCSIKESAKQIATEMNKEFVDWNTIDIETKNNIITNPDKWYVFVDLRLTQLEPSDLRGLPNLNEKHFVEWKANLWAEALRVSAGCLFFDEINLACFPKGTLVATENGVKPIEQIQKEELVLNKDGEYEKVKTPMPRKYNGKLYKIKAENLVPFECTDEHPILTTKRTKYASIKNKKNPKGWGRVAEFSNPEWVNAKDLTTEHYVAVPTLKGDLNVKELDLSPFLSKALPRKVNVSLPLTKDLAFLMGLFTADGCASKNRLAIYLGSHEKELIEKIKEIVREQIGYKIEERTERNCIGIRFAGNILGQAFRTWFGVGAKNKEVPQFIMRNSDKEILKEFLKGYFAGDGSFVNNRTISFSTVSNSLAHQIQLAFTRFGVLLNVNRDTKQRTTEVCFEGKKRTIKSCGNSYIMKTNQNEGYDVLDITTPLKKQRRVKSSFPKESYIFTKIQKINERQFNDEVYNFETEKTHTYVVNNAVVHNCPSLQASVYQILLDRCIGEMPLNKDVAVFGAGNMSEDKAGIYDLPKTIRTRGGAFELNVPSVADWTTYAVKHQLDGRVVAFLNRFNQEIFVEDEKNDDIVTPRGWEFVSDLIMNNQNLDDMELYSSGVLGSAVGLKFVSFIKLIDKIPTPQEILNRKKKIPKEMDLKYACIASLTEHFRQNKKKERFDIVKKYIDLKEDLEPEFFILGLRLMKGIQDDIVKELIGSPAFDKIMEYQDYLT